MPCLRQTTPELLIAHTSSPGPADTCLQPVRGGGMFVGLSTADPSTSGTVTTPALCEVDKTEP